MINVHIRNIICIMNIGYCLFGHGQDYAQVSGKQVHLVVWRTFRPNDPPVGDETIDHKDRDETNNALHNLRRATKSEQICNQNRPLPDDIIRPRTAVLAWKDGDSIESAERFVGQHAAERALNEREQTNKFNQSCIAQSVRDGCRHNGWRFALERVPDEERVAREAEHQRVLAAIASLVAFRVESS